MERMKRIVAYFLVPRPTQNDKQMYPFDQFDPLNPR
jgi:hypothetical protein